MYFKFRDAMRGFAWATAILASSFSPMIDFAPLSSVRQVFSARPSISYTNVGVDDAMQLGQFLELPRSGQLRAGARDGPFEPCQYFDQVEHSIPHACFWSNAFIEGHIGTRDEGLCAKKGEP